jgi:hypothetical protein
VKLTPKQRVVLECIDAVHGGIHIATINPKLRPIAQRLQDWGAISKRSRYQLRLTKFGRAALAQHKEK